MLLLVSQIRAVEKTALHCCVCVCCAAALNYGVFRQASFNTTPQYIMFYDAGALSTTASIIGECESTGLCGSANV